MAVISIPVCAAAPRCLESLARMHKQGRGVPYHAEGEQCVQLDKTMEVAKYDRHRKEDHISWLPHEKTNQLDDFGEKHEGKLQYKSDPLLFWRPALCGLDCQEDDERVEENRQRRKCCDVQSIG